jgi:hypothetical protein
LRFAFQRAKWIAIEGCLCRISVNEYVYGRTAGIE